MRTLLAIGLLGIMLVRPVSAATPFAGEVPFELFHNSVVAKVMFKDQPPCDVLIDTGADPSIIDLARARDMGLHLASRGFQGDGGGTQANVGYPTVLRDVHLGNLTVSSVEAVALDLSAPSRGLGRPLCGVLGYSLLRGHIVQFDYPHQTVRFLSRSVKAQSDAIVLGFRYRNDLLVDGLKVNHQPVVANFDTGSNGNFQFTADAVARLDLDKEVESSTPSESVGFNGTSSNRQGHVAEIEVGPDTIESPDVVFYGAHTGRDHVHWDVRVGNGFFKAYCVTFDFTKNLVTLERSEATGAP